MAGGDRGTGSRMPAGWSSHRGKRFPFPEAADMQESALQPGEPGPPWNLPRTDP